MVYPQSMVICFNDFKLILFSNSRNDTIGPLQMAGWLEVQAQARSFRGPLAASETFLVRSKWC